MLIDPTPRNLDRSWGVLASAATRLLHAERPAEDELRRFRVGLRKAGSLLEGAARYHRDWQNILRAMAAGYTPEGEAAPFSTPGRISMQG